jgi:hypothetical protein
MRRERVGNREKAIEFWIAFIEPLVKKLGKYWLPDAAAQKPRARKTKILSSGSWQFTKSGGHSLFDFAEFKKWRSKQLMRELVREKGTVAGTIAVEELLAEIQAGRLLFVLDYQKEAAAVRDGKYPNAPGTKSEPVNPFASVKLKLEKHNANE